VVFQVSGSPSGVLETSKGLVDSSGGGNTGSLRPLFDKGSVTPDFCCPVFMGAAEIGGSETLVDRGFWEGGISAAVPSEEPIFCSGSYKPDFVVVWKKLGLSRTKSD